jgi:hypothetical protein
MHLDPDRRFNTSGECLQAYPDLQCYTVFKNQTPDLSASMLSIRTLAQHAGGPTRPITVAFGLIGLDLALEKGYRGREVQKAHMKIAKIHKNWPFLRATLPACRFNGD